MGLKPNDSLLNGKYLIEGVLGRGGFGLVYLARDSLLGRPVAIKEMNPTQADDEQMVRRFLAGGPRRAAGAPSQRRRTVRCLLRLWRLLPGHFSEYCPGGSLEERLAAGPLAQRDACRPSWTAAQGWRIPTAAASFTATSNRLTSFLAWTVRPK